MHVTLETTDLRHTLELVSRISTKHATLPVLQCVLLDVKANTLTITATNLEIGIEATVTATVSEMGSIAVPATTLLQTIALIQHQTVALRVEENSLVVEGDGSETQIKSISHDEFPSIPKVSGEGQTIQKTLFALGIKTAAFAASQSSIKPELGSIYIHQRKEHSLTFVATDSFRLMEKTVAQKGVTLDEALMIPQKNALELARVCDLETEDPVLKVSENQCALEFPSGVYITSRLVAGSFPDYQQIIPKEYAAHTTLLKGDLAHAFKKSSIFLNKFLQIRFHVTNKSLTLHTDGGEVGTTTESVKATTEGEELSISFNQRYVAEALPHIVSDSIVMHFAGIGRPMVVEGVDDNTLRYLVMPMNK